MPILLKFSTSLFSYTWFCCCLFLLKIMSPSLISSHLLLSSFLPPSLHLYQFLSTPPTTLQSCVSRAAEQSCQKQCSPRSYQLNSYSNRTGPFVVKTIKRCHANSHHCQNCQRKPNRFYVFPNSKYHQKIDVGKCSGVCSEEGSASDMTTPTSLTCQPTRTRSMSIEGPNGHVTVEVIENCSCVSEQCYRADHFQSVSVRNPDNRRQEELVNTGKCIGSCQGVLLNGRCLQYYQNGRCTWYLPGIQGKCRPTRGSTFSYTDLSGHNKTLPVVEECGCTTGWLLSHDNHMTYLQLFSWPSRHKFSQCALCHYEATEL
jgi:hypothetical protein